MAKVKETAAILSQEQLAKGIYSMWIHTEAIASQAVPGQFINIYTRDGAKLLPRPISLCEIDEEGKKLRIVYRVAGEGTREFSRCKAGEMVDILGPLGNGFPLEEGAGKKVLLIGGGIGIPPMLETARRLEGDKTIILGYRDSQTFLQEEFQALGTVFTATEDGSIGVEGNVLDAIRQENIQGEIIFACGPIPMLRGVKEYAAERNMGCLLSLEERMACGIGACLACVCQSRGIDSHSQVKNKRICKDGPVFWAEEVEL